MQANFLSNPNIQPLRPTFNSEEQQLNNARQLQTAFQDFVGKSFYGEMMRSRGRAERAMMKYRR